MKIKVMLLLSVSIIFNSYSISTLIGVINNTTSKATGRTPSVRFRGEQMTIPMSTLQANNRKLPVTIDLTYGLGSQAKNYSIIVSDTSSASGCLGNSRVVEAKAQINGGDVPNSAVNVCIPTTVSVGLVGSNAFQWQTIVLAIADNGDFDKNAAIQDENALPFKFVLSSWTSSKGLWANKKIFSIPGTNIKFKDGLNVIQGYAGWGDVNLPRFGFGHISDVFNDTEYIITMYRQSTDPKLAKTDFNNLIPPMSAVPKAMAWIPKIPTSMINDPSKSALKLYAMYAPDRDDLPVPPGFEPIRKAGPSELEPTTQSIQGILDNIQTSIPLQEEITGQKSLTEYIPNELENFAVGKYYYKIFSLSDGDKSIYIEQCDKNTNECKVLQNIKQPATNSVNSPNYFRLILTPDKNNIINFKIDPITTNVMEQYLK